MGKICIVLDDVNNGDIEWGFVLSNLSMNLQGSKIIATTRKEEVFGQMKQVSLQKLSKLSDEDCWSLFEKIAFGNGLGKTDELTRIGRQIVEKCQGEALAAKIIGSFLCSKKHEDDWLFVLNNKIWDAEKRDERLKGILKLRYDHLAPPLKKCISYCFIFHKCSVINKNKLIRSWMAENFLGSSMEVRALESIGKEYFNILMCNSFFKIVKRNVSGEIKSCRINDLIHDLEPSIVEAECSIVDVSEINEGKGMDRIRRMCLLFGTDHDISYIPTGTYKAMKLRTLNYSVSRVGKEIIKRVPEDLCFKLTFLRVLDLSHSAIRELPSSIGKLKLLSYLDISYTSVTTLPDSLTKLYNLRTLKLKSCCLREFPKEMRKLIGLRHLINSNNRSGQPKMPFELSKLSCLQKLSVFAVSKDSGFGIKELKVLSLLEGKLQIHNLENVSNESGAEDANLKNKTKISHVELYWSKDTGKHTDTASNVLEHLQPPQSLKNLVIHNFPGREFPTWLPANLPKLVSISLVNCYSCQLLPALGKLKSLKVLHLRKMNSVALIDDKFYRDSEEPFSALKELHLSEMSNLKWFNSSSSCFGCLEWLKIDKCTKLNVTPTLFPSLQKFEVSNSIGVAINSLVASNLKTLTSIEITRSVELTSLPHGLLQGNGVLQILEISDCKNFDGILPKQQAHQSQVRHNSSLKSLRIYHCPKLTSLPTVQGWISLHDLRIVDCRRLKFLPDGLQDLSKLEYLHIGGFSEDLECLPDQLQVLTSLQHLILEDFPSLVTLPNWLGNFCFLRKLVIRRCEKLKSLPSEEQMRRLTALQIVQLEQCPLLEDKGLGGESDKLAHIILQRDRPY
ncbi:putative disease resistance protein RGA3 [Papaver somniferum]|uniref:putative disease resistance protein RGA3 n=1 Tax=Papaver somniferum TaxID=3469 RepID=UPI000E6F7CCB|nr:putative disease resistance protein RGA3 [Papaver somniferum]